MTASTTTTLEPAMTTDRTARRTDAPSCAVARMPSPVGELRIVVSDLGVRAILWENDDDRIHDTEAEPIDADDDPVARRTVDQLGEYFAGERTEFDVPLDLVGTEFQVAAWRALGEIPFGETRTYGEQAAGIGRPTAVRAIGAANGKNPLSIVLPCHRVVGADGSPHRLRRWPRRQALPADPRAVGQRARPGDVVRALIADQRSGMRQSTGSRPAATSAALVRENGRLPKKPLRADSGDGCADSMMTWRLGVDERLLLAGRRAPEDEHDGLGLVVHRADDLVGEHLPPLALVRGGLAARAP